MGRGLGIFSARPKTPFVPCEATTRDKRPFCPGLWLHPGQKTPPIYLPSSSAFSQHCQFLICALCRRRPLLPPPPARRRRRPRAPPTSAARGRAARAPLPHCAPSSPSAVVPFELLPTSAVVCHRRPPPVSPVPSSSVP